MKKPSVPDGTPPWLRMFLEILAGRRGNRIAVPAAQTLTFSNPPTQAECEALYAYVNEIRTAVESLIDRFDE